MIDEKIIDEGARDYINKNGYFIKYDEDPCVDIEYAYKEGARWAINKFLNGLWHDASEEPKVSKWIVTRFLNDDNDLVYEVDLNINIRDWKTYVQQYRIVKWLYIDDLLKGGAE